MQLQSAGKCVADAEDQTDRLNLTKLLTRAENHKYSRNQKRKKSVVSFYRRLPPLPPLPDATQQPIGKHSAVTAATYIPIHTPRPTPDPFVHGPSKTCRQVLALARPNESTPTPPYRRHHTTSPTTPHHSTPTPFPLSSPLPPTLDLPFPLPSIPIRPPHTPPPPPPPCVTPRHSGYV